MTFSVVVVLHRYSILRGRHIRNWAALLHSSFIFRFSVYFHLIHALCGVVAAFLHLTSLPAVIVRLASIHAYPQILTYFVLKSCHIAPIHRYCTTKRVTSRVLVFKPRHVVRRRRFYAGKVSMGTCSLRKLHGEVIMLRSVQTCSS